MGDLPQLYTREEVAAHLRLTERQLRRRIAETFTGRRKRVFNAAEIELLREDEECRCTSRGNGPVTGMRAARSKPAVKASSSRNTPRDVANDLMLKMLRKSETAKSETGSSKGQRPRS